MLCVFLYPKEVNLEEFLSHPPAMQLINCINWIDINEALGKNKYIVVILFQIYMKKMMKDTVNTEWMFKKKNVEN